MPRIIKNASQLAVTPQRKTALAILEAGYRAIQIKKILKTTVLKEGGVLKIKGKTYDLSQYRRIAVIGIGKCSLEAGEYLEKLLGDKLSGGIILDTRRANLKKLISVKGDHPLPSVKNIAYTKKILSYLDILNPSEDLVIFVVSGGGSSLFCMPEGIALSDYTKLTADLHKSGATIHELNCVRKHLESIKGGKMAKLLWPLETIVLYFSDVLSTTDNKNLKTIASGPLYRDTTTNTQAKQILKKYRLWEKYKGRIKMFSETPKVKKNFSHVHHHLLLTNSTALLAMAKTASSMELRPKILTAAFESRARDAFVKIRNASRIYSRCNLFLAGGETTVKVEGRGKGGRNQEAVLGALERIAKNELFVSTASDGIDFTLHAGAIADNTTKRKAIKKNLDSSAYLAENDSYTFFKKTGDYIKTGKTGSNIADLLLYYKK